MIDEKELVPDAVDAREARVRDGVGLEAFALDDRRRAGSAEDARDDRHVELVDGVCREEACVEDAAAFANDDAAAALAGQPLEEANDVDLRVPELRERGAAPSAARLAGVIVDACATTASPPRAGSNILAVGSMPSPARVTTTRSVLGIRSGSSARRLLAPMSTASVRARSASIRRWSSSWRDITNGARFRAGAIFPSRLGAMLQRTRGRTGGD